MNDVLGMRGVECVGDLGGDIERLLVRDPLT